MRRRIGPEPLGPRIGRVLLWLAICLIGSTLTAIGMNAVNEYLGVGFLDPGSAWVITMLSGGLSIAAMFWRRDRKVSASVFYLLVIAAIVLAHLPWTDAAFGVGRS